MIGSGVDVPPGGSKRATNGWTVRPAGCERSSSTVTNPHVTPMTTFVETSSGHAAEANDGVKAATACEALSLAFVNADEGGWPGVVGAVELVGAPEHAPTMIASTASSPTRTAAVERVFNC